MRGKRRMLVNLPGEIGEWEIVDPDTVTRLCAEYRDTPNATHIVEDILAYIARSLGVEVRYVDYSVYRQHNAPAWQKREHFKMPPRQLPVWVNEPFWKNNTKIHYAHFVHV